MAWVPIALAVVGAAAQAKGQAEAGVAANQASQYNAQVAVNNNIIANQNADYAVKSGIEKASLQSLKGRAISGRIKAAQAANGIDVNSGSALDVQTGEREKNVLDTDTTLSNAQLTAYGYRTNATNFAAQSQLDVAEGENAETAGNTKALGTLLNGASGIAGKWGGGDGAGALNNPNATWTTPSNVVNAYDNPDR